MYLFLDTHTTEDFSIAVFSGGKWRSQTVRAKYQQSELLLPTIKKFINLKKLRGVAVVSGPGSFSGLRLGIMVANTIAWAKHLSVIGLELRAREPWTDWRERAMIKLIKTKFGRLVAPRYGREPNITIKKK